MEEGEHESDGSYKRANHVDEEWDHRPTITGKTKQDKMMLALLTFHSPTRSAKVNYGISSSRGKMKEE